MKKFILFLTLGIHFQLSNAQNKSADWPGCCWTAGFMTAGANAGSFRHFLLQPDGTLVSFAPGEAPQPFPGIDHVKAISAGKFHMLALKDDGTVWSWGKNDDMQLGVDRLKKNKDGSPVPLQVPGINNAVAISAYYSNSYVLLKDGTVWAWGNGNAGMTGDGKPLSARGTSSNWSARPVPVQVKGIHNAIAISGPMALLSDGTIMVWGDGMKGQLGNGTNSIAIAPVQVSGINNAIAISYRDEGALALLADGTVWAWGNNYKGQLGNGAKNLNQDVISNIPVPVKNISNAIAISADDVCMALLKDGSVRVWGWGAVGGMGTGVPGTHDVNPLPLKVPDVDHVIAIKAGNGYGLALKGDGTLIGWGADMVATGIYHQTWKPVTITHIDIK